MTKKVSIKEIPLALRPREKFKKYGVACLDNSELLAILLGSGVEGKNVSDLEEFLKPLQKEKKEHLVAFSAPKIA